VGAPGKAAKGLLAGKAAKGLPNKAGGAAPDGESPPPPEAPGKLARPLMELLAVTLAPGAPTLACGNVVAGPKPNPMPVPKVVVMGGLPMAPGPCVTACGGAPLPPAVWPVWPALAPTEPPGAPEGCPTGYMFCKSVSVNAAAGNKGNGPFTLVGGHASARTDQFPSGSGSLSGPRRSTSARWEAATSFLAWLRPESRR